MTRTPTPGPLSAVTVTKCLCGHASCSDYWLNGIGKFCQGSGFDKDEAELIAGLLNARLAPAAGEVPLGGAERDIRPLVERLKTWGTYHANSNTRSLLLEAAEALRTTPAPVARLGFTKAEARANMVQADGSPCFPAPVAETAGEAAPYVPAMGEAGNAYIARVAFDGRHTLPAMFRWHELWDVLNKAHPSPPPAAQDDRLRIAAKPFAAHAAHYEMKPSSHTIGGYAANGQPASRLTVGHLRAVAEALAAAQQDSTKPTDRETAIQDLRAAGYMVMAPGEENFR